MSSAVKNIGTLLVQRGLLSEEQLDSCLREHASGGSATLSQIILSRGYTDAERLTRTLESLGSLKFRCPEGCGSLSVQNLRLDNPYSCKQCGAALETEDPQVSWTSTSESELPADVVEASRDAKRRLGKYVLVKELGRGGSASVYKAWDSILCQFVALKLIISTGAGFAEDRDSKEVQAFLREARTAVKLSHPNIVRVYEVGCQEGRYYLSMELIEGGSLARLIGGKDASRRPLFYADPKRFLTILRDTAKALDYAHHQKPPIVHRDVKPHNILVDASNRACLADFGLAREIGGAGRLTVTGVAKGTPCYMAPEQAKIHGSELDGRTDVYGLGAILYEFLTGNPPFTGSSSHEILQKVVSEDAPAPSQVLRSRNIPTVPPEALEKIAFKALEKDPKSRYASAADFAADIDRYLHGKDVAATGISPATRGVRWVARRRSIALPVAIAVVMGIVALVAVLRSGKERVVERVVVQKEKSEGIESRVAEVDALAAGLRFSEAIQKCSDLRGETKDPAVLARLQQMDGDLRLEREMLKGLVDRIRIQPRDYAQFPMGGTTIPRAQVVDATVDRITIVGGGLRSGYPWSSVDPKQVVQLVRDYWPGLEGKPALGLALWARRHKLDGTAKATPSESSELQYFKLLREAERALSEGDLAMARGRFEKALELQRDGKEAQEGLDRLVAAEIKKAAEQPVVVKAPEVRPPASEPPPVAVLKNQKLADEHYQKGNRLFDSREYLAAMDEFTRSIPYATKQGDAFAMRGYARFMLGQWISARGDLVAAASAGSWSNNYVQLFLWIVSARLGDKATATEELRSYTLKGAEGAASHATWFRAISSYLTNDLQESALVQLSKEESAGMKQAEKECEAFFYIGVRQLIEGRRSTARKWFQKSVQTGVTAFVEHKAAEAELDRLGAADEPEPAAVEAPAAKPAPPKAGALPPPPALAGNEKLILTVPQLAYWQVLSIGPGGTEVAYKESRPRGKTSVVWRLGRLDDVDRVENVCLWKDGRCPVLKVEIGGKVHVTDGSDIHEAWTSATIPIMSPNRQSVAFVAQDGPKTYVVAHGEKSEVLEVPATSLGYTPGNQVVYHATVPTTPTGTMSGWFVDRSPLKLPGIGASAVMPPAFSAEGGRSAYSIGEALCVDGSYGPSFYRVHSPRFSADGKAVAYVAEVLAGGGSPPKTKKVVVVGSIPGFRYDDINGTPVLSGDGRVLAYIAKRGERWLVVQGTRAGEEFDMIFSRIYDVEQPVMSPDGKVVAYTAERSGLRVVIVNGKEVDTQPQASAPSISADGKTVSYGFVTGPYFIWKTVPVPGR